MMRIHSYFLISSILYFIVALTFNAKGQTRAYYLNESHLIVITIDTAKSEFEYFAPFDNGGWCRGVIRKASNDMYILNSDYDIKKLPLIITPLKCNSEKQLRDFDFSFNFGNDANVLRAIRESKTKIDTGFISSVLIGADDTEIANELKKASLYKPALRLIINDSINIPLYNDTVSYHGLLNSIFIGSSYFHIKSEKYYLDTTCRFFQILFNMKAEFTNYHTITNNVMKYRKRNSIVIQTNKNVIYKFNKVNESAARKYMHK